MEDLIGGASVTVKVRDADMTLSADSRTRVSAPGAAARRTDPAHLTCSARVTHLAYLPPPLRLNVA